MSATEAATLKLEDATASLWVGACPAGWSEVVQLVGMTTRTAGDAIAAAGLDWRVMQHPVEAVVGEGAGSLRVPVPRVVANVRSDTGAVLGVVGRGYEPLQNRDAFVFADALVDSGEAHWLGAGCTRGGARIHAVMRLDREIRIGGADGEDVLPLLLLRNGHDGGLAVTVAVAPFRLACLNGLVVPIEGAARTWKARHTANVTTKLADARRSLAIAWRYYDGLQELGDRLIRERISLPEFERFLSRLVPCPRGSSPNTSSERAARNAERVREGIRDAYLSAADLDHVRGTRWGALQAVSAYHDHHARIRRVGGRSTSEIRFERATEAAAIKDRALELLA